MKIIVGITGASGAIYALKLLQALDNTKRVVILSRWGKYIMKEETGVEGKEIFHYCEQVYSPDDFTCPFASGSAHFDALVVVPCSCATLGKIAHGIGDNLITRIAEVALKERRKLLLAIRETPLSTVSLENALKVSQAGGIIFPLAPGFYRKPKSIEDIVNFCVERILNLLGLSTQVKMYVQEMEQS